MAALALAEEEAPLTAVLRRIVWCWAVALTLALAPAAHAQSRPLRRFLLAVAANEGGAGRDRLAYAEHDVAGYVAVLQQLGGVLRDDVVRLSQPTPQQLRSALRELAVHLREAQRGERVEFLFYYSGHSDDRGLLLDDERVTYDELRAQLAALEADVRIAVLDSCASGAFTRRKGGVARPPFVYDVSTDVRGHAFLTASSESEAAQESDQIGGSFFTHFLISGLRGAADASGDGRVTLTEAYRFAFDETLARTGPTRGGAQHPAYDIQLAGTGDLVMTDLRATSASLRLDERLAGRLYVREANGALSAELRKPEGRSLVLALPPGEYLIELAGQRRFEEARVRALAGAPRALEPADFRPVRRVATRLRGGRVAYERHALAAAFIPPYATNPQERTRPVMNHFDLALLYDDPDAVEGVALSLGGSAARDHLHGLQLGLFFSDTGLLGGLQLSALLDLAREGGAGLQLAGLVAYAGSAFAGVQVAPFNVIESLRGLQLTLGGNLATERVRGAQVGALSATSALEGVQLSGVNVAKALRGVQIGAVNVVSGAARGLQLGLFNYAGDVDVSLAPVGITREGGVHAQLSSSDVAVLQAMLRFDARYSYTLIGIGVHPMGGATQGSYLLGAGLGGKIPTRVRRLWVDLDLLHHFVQPLAAFRRELPNQLSQLRIALRCDIVRHFSVFAGASFNVLLQLDAARRLEPGYRLRRHELFDNGTTRFELWPGFVVGLRL